MFRYSVLRYLPSFHKVNKISERAPKILQFYNVKQKFLFAELKINLYICKD